MRFRLLLLVALTCAPLVVALFHSVGEERRSQLSRWQQHGEQLTRLSRREETDLLGGTRQLLLVLAESSAVSTADWRAVRKLLASLQAGEPRFANLGVLSTNGRVLASARPLPPSLQPALQACARRALATGTFAQDDQPPALDQAQTPLLFEYPVMEQTNRAQILVFAALDPHWPDRFVSDVSAQLPPGATWSVVNQNGLLLSRYPGPEGWFGRPLPEQAALIEIGERSTGVVQALDSKGVPCFYAFNSTTSELTGGRIITLLGIPRAVLFAEADTLLRRNLIWLGLAALVATGVGWLGARLLILRPVKTLVSAGARLLLGESAPRPEPVSARDEWTQLIRTFHQLAEVLGQRDQERKTADQKLHALSHRLVEVQETERRSIARELHDEIGQTLTAAEMHLQAALRTPVAPAIEQRLQESIRAVEQVLEQVRDLSLNLRPSMLDDLGLEPALRWYAQRQASLAGLKVRFHADPLEQRLDPVIETECFRVAQEALTNVVRHAQAKSVSVSLTRNESRLHLSVCDDGAGFEAAEQRDKAMRGASLGLLSMEERASLANGGFECKSVPGHGTEIRAWFPLKWKTEPFITQLNE